MTLTEIQILQEDTTNRKKAVERTINMFSNLRLLLFVVALMGAVAYFRMGQMLGLVVAVLGLTAFMYFVQQFNRHQRYLGYLDSREAVLKRYHDRLNDQWHTLVDDGARYMTRDDVISADLDVFGPRSLYQYLSIAHTGNGQDALARLLTTPDLRYIVARQDSVRELLQSDDFVIDFETLGYQPNPHRYASERKAEAALRAFAKGETTIPIPFLTVLSMLLPAVTLAGIGLAVFKLVPMVVPIGLVLTQIGMTILFADAINTRKAAVLQFKTRLNGLALRLESLLEADFSSDYLRLMQQDLADARQGLAALNRLAARWQLRENFILYWPLCGVLGWDFNCIQAIDKWRAQYGDAYGKWLDWMGEVEALMSLGTLGRIRGEECTFPNVVEGAPYVAMEDGKHPLLRPNTVVGNDYHQTAQTVIITGSNMSGKSTFLRTLGLNLILTYAGGMVCAKRFDVSPMRLFTSMRVRDDVSEGISTFYGEILRIREMAAYAKEQRPMLVLIDEIFKGTNSADRIIGAEAAIRKLTKPWIMTLVSTHDFELCALADDPVVAGLNYHFEEHYEGDTILFDYKIRPDRCHTTNAKHLMRMAGLLDENE